MSQTYTPQNNFFMYVNGDWLNDESIKIPEEYPIWGSFTMLRDKSLLDQIELMKEIQAKYKAGVQELNQEKNNLSLIWIKSMKRFENWRDGKGDYSPISIELNNLEEKLSGSGDDFLEGLALHFSRCQRFGIDYPFGLSAQANLRDSNNNILNLESGGLSLPSRDYYFDAKFEPQRTHFLNHLQNVQNLVIANHSMKLEDDFVNKVFRFEKKLAHITMTPSMLRLYDKYFTLTTIDGMIKNMNTLNYLEEKENLYKEENEFENDPDKELLSTSKYEVSEEHCQKVQEFLHKIYDDLDLTRVLRENYVKSYGEGSDDDINKLAVFDGDYFRRVFHLIFAQHNRSDLKAFLQYKLIIQTCSYCTKELDEEFFDFYSRKLQGKQKPMTDEKRTVNLVNAWLGMALGKLYVAKHFPESEKQNVKEMIGEVLKVMDDSLKNNDWLSESTKDRALEKLKRFTVKIGYPDRWKTYDGLIFTPEDTLFSMQLKVNEFDFNKEFLDELNVPKDKSKWLMTPQTVNAYFHPVNNEIVFPASILQPPFYYQNGDKINFKLEGDLNSSGVIEAANYGGIGAVIAHEITHGFDDQGRKFDSEGNMKDWWEKDDEAKFLEKAELMNMQAEKYIFVDTDEETGETKEYRMNGKLCTGENLADLGGMSLGVKAMLNKLHPTEEAIDLNLRKLHLQAFFCSWANIWKAKSTKEFKITKLATDPHAPEDFRGNAVKNNPYFYEAYDITEQDSMYLHPEIRVQMW